MRSKVLEVLGNKCIKCGFSDSRALQVDHINGGGHKERLNLGGWNICKKIISGYTSAYQLLCANCNAIKRIENKEHRNAVIL